MERQVQVPTVYVVDDDEAVRRSLAVLFGSVRLKVQTFGTGEEFLAAVSKHSRGCLILDVRMPGMGGLELQRRLAERGVRMPVLMISGHADVPMAVRALKGGAADFLEKPFNQQELLEKVQGCLAQYAREEEEQRVIEVIKRRLDTLTPREREIMPFMIDGRQSKDIGVALGISPKTVDVHRAHVLEKMGISSVAELVRLVMQVQYPGIR
jgi:two-component system response regulator FixJ